MLAAKTGLATMPGAMYAGDIEVVDIGIPPEQLLNVPERIMSIDEDMVRSFIPERDFDIHKGQRGCVTAIGSSPEYRGAIALTALASLKSGSGLVFTISSKEAQQLISHFLPEVITMGCSFQGHADTAEICNKIDMLARRTNGFVIGPGLGRSSLSARLLDHLWNNLEGIPAVVDADALFHLSVPGNSYNRRANVVLTPHEGEAARLLNCDIESVRSNRLECARKLAQKWGVVVLKGPRTLVDDGYRTAVVLEGSPSLAIPGSGDILSGIIASFLASGTDPFDSACAASWIHARIGQVLAVESGIDGILARDIAYMVPSLLQEIRSTI
jgi:NAD(P)H-hydrate epimerase